MMTGAIAASPRFRRDFRSASPRLKHLVNQELRTVELNMRENPLQWTRKYDRLGGSHRENVLEIKVGGAWRLWAVLSSDLTLLTLRHHNDNGQIHNLDIRSLVATAGPLPDDLARIPFPPQTVGDSVVSSWVEGSHDWLFFMGPQQIEILESTVSELEEDLLSQRPSCHLILGGPGTGKTVLLLDMLRRLGAVNPDCRETWDVRLRGSAALLSMVRASTGWDLDTARFSDEDPMPDLLLVDDPASSREVSGLFAKVRDSGHGAVVVAVDPFQFDHSFTDALLENMVAKYRLSVSILKQCYRQKANVGRSARQFLEEGRPFSTAERHRRKRLEAYDEVEFPNLSGIVRSFDPATKDDWSAMTTWLSGVSQRMWKYWPSVLLVVDDNANLPDAWSDELSSSIGIEEISAVALDDVASIRGLEFQHLALVVARRTVDRLQREAGRDMSGADAWRLLRVPLTRARDSSWTFIL